MLYVQWKCIAPTPTTTSTSTTTTDYGPLCAQGYILPTDTCASSSNYSQYVPQRMASSTSTYFGYPIYEQTICQNGKLILACGASQAIHVYAAYFGIQAYTATSTCTANTTEIPAACYFTNSYDIIRATCEYQNSCYLRATPTQVGGGDLCPSYQKQLYVQYQCFDAAFLNSTVSQCVVSTSVPSICATASSGSGSYSQVWCDGTTMSITCANAAQNINVQCAFYGIHPSVSSCNIGTLQSRPVCYFASSFTQVKSVCNGLNSCTIGNFSMFKDPCNGLDKALYVSWTCS
jgi:hypothetical protein